MNKPNKPAVQQLLRQLLASYTRDAAKFSPQQIANMGEVWSEMLSDFDDGLLTAAVTQHIQNSQWFPSVAEIRAAVVSLVRLASPARQNAGEAWYDVKRAIASVGHYFNGPSFDNPATAAVVKRMGWREICLDSGPEGVLRAQFERMYNAEIERLTQMATMSPAVSGFVDAMSTHSLPERNQARQIIGDVAKRLEAPR